MIPGARSFRGRQASQPPVDVVQRFLLIEDFEGLGHDHFAVDVCLQT